jgi:cell division protease FtsH
MVCDWGMSDLGMISFGDKQDQVFLGKELTRAQNYSEETAQKIDSAIKRVIDEQYERAKEILQEKISALHTTAQALLEYETIEGKHIHEILEHGKILSPVLNSKPDEGEEAETEESSAPQEDLEQEKGDDITPGGEPAGMPA